MRHTIYVSPFRNGSSVSMNKTYSAEKLSVTDVILPLYRVSFYKPDRRLVNPKLTCKEDRRTQCWH